MPSILAIKSNFEISFVLNSPTNSPFFRTVIRSEIWERLIEEMRDENDGHSFVPQGPNDPEELLHFSFIQTGGRLVEDEYLGGRIQHAGDGYHLLNRNGR